MGKLQFGRYDYACQSAFIGYAMCSLSIPVSLVFIGKSLNFPLDGGGMAAGGVMHLTREPFHAGMPPEDLFLRLISELSHISPTMQYQASGTALEILHTALDRVGGCSLLGQPTSHTTVRAVRHTAVQQFE